MSLRFGFKLREIYIFQIKFEEEKDKKWVMH